MPVSNPTLTRSPGPTPYPPPNVPPSPPDPSWPPPSAHGRNTWTCPGCGHVSSGPPCSYCRYPNDGAVPAYALLALALLGPDAIVDPGRHVCAVCGATYSGPRCPNHDAPSAGPPYYCDVCGTGPEWSAGGSCHRPGCTGTYRRAVLTAVKGDPCPKCKHDPCICSIWGAGIPDPPLTERCARCGYIHPASSSCPQA